MLPDRTTDTHGTQSPHIHTAVRIPLRNPLDGSRWVADYSAWGYFGAADGASRKVALGSISHAGGTVCLKIVGGTNELVCLFLGSWKYVSELDRSGNEWLAAFLMFVEAVGVLSRQLIS